MAGIVPPSAATTTAAQAPKGVDAKIDEKVDYLNLPCPIPYEEIHREALSQYQTLFYYYQDMPS